MATKNEKIAASMKGNTNSNPSIKRGVFTAQLTRAVLANPKKLEKIITKLLDEAEEGNMTAIKEVVDRLDGKAVAAIEMSGPDGNPIEIEQAGTFAKELMAKVLALKQKEADN
jgi:hypothetical protein